jgi:O-antigen ligase
MIGPVHWISAATKFQTERYARFVDAVVVAVAVSLPWSTSATGILVGLWLIAIIPMLDVAAVRRTLAAPAGGIPVLLWVLALIGILWGFDVSWAERWAGLKGFHKLLLIPLLIIQFRRSERAVWVLNGFLLSCGVLLAVSLLLIVHPTLSGTWARPGNSIGVPVKDYIAQSGEFTICIFVLGAVALKAGRVQRRWYSLTAMLLALVFMANVLYVANSRTALVVIPVLLLLFACKHLRWREMILLLLAGVVAVALIALLVRPVRDNVTNLLNEMRQYQPTGERTRAGERLEYWRKSIGFIADAPVVGHGTGSVHDQFRRSISHQTGMAAMASENPHNQTFAVAIQLGLVGAAVLFAMWMAHLSLFRGGGFAAWVGLVIVTQNIVGSLFNSHLFDFTQGWTYVVGVGVTAGVVFKERVFGAA